MKWINLRFFLSTPILFLVVGCSPDEAESKNERYTHKIAVSEKLLAHTQTQLDGVPVALRKYVLSEDRAILQFVHRREEGPGWHGNTYVLYDLRNDNPIWTLKWLTDFEPHSFIYTDFNRDGKKDIAFYAGFEDVFITKVYLSNLSNLKHANNNYILAYENNNSYVMFADIDKDGTPEMLEEVSSKTDEPRFCAKEGEFIELSAKSSTAINNEYDRIVGSFDKYNFKYGSKKHYKISNISLLAKMRPIEIVGKKPIDVSRKYKIHFKWRADTLQEIQNSNPKSCRNMLGKIREQNLSIE